MEQIAKLQGKGMVLLKSLVISYFVTGLLLMLLAFLLYKFHLGEGVVCFGIIVIYVLAAFLAGYYSGKKLKSKKFLWGLCVGASYFLILLGISFAVNRGFGDEMKDFVSTLVLCIGSGMLGGMVS